MATPSAAPSEKLGQRVTVYGTYQGSANVRSGPGTGFQVVDHLAYREPVTAQEVSGTDWYKIAPGKYIAASVVSTVKPAEVRAFSGGSTGNGGTALDRCIDLVDPDRTASWHHVDRGGWGATDMGNGSAWIAPRTPSSRLCDVVRHEWLHVLQYRSLGTQAIPIANQMLGTRGLAGLEEVADCGALMLGAQWINYGCNSDTARRIASELLSGEPVK